MWSWLRNLFRRKPTYNPEAPPAPWVPKFFDEVTQDIRYTPDAAELFRKPFHYLLSIDETQMGHHQEILLRNCQKQDEEGFMQDRCMMLRHDLGIFSTPLVFLDDLGYKNPPKLLPIKGELYKVPPMEFFELDKYKGNTVSSFRRLMPVILPYTELFFKDRETAKHFQTLVEGGGGADISTSLIKRPGIRRGMAWVYVSDRYFWEDMLNMNTDHPPVKVFPNPKGMVREYYRFTHAEYNNRPPWE